MRSEHFERLRRLAERGADPGFDPAKPWYTVFKLAIEDKLWWDEHLHRPAVLFLTNVKTATQTAEDGTVQQGIPHGRGNGRHRSRSRKAHRGGGRGLPHRPEGRNGHEVRNTVLRCLQHTRWVQQTELQILPWVQEVQGAKAWPASVRLRTQPVGSHSQFFGLQCASSSGTFQARWRPNGQGPQTQ